MESGRMDAQPEECTKSSRIMVSIVPRIVDPKQRAETVDRERQVA
jgi:hypothetical protein